MKNNKYKINLEQDRPIINILGEICWGFQIDNFQEKIGVKKEIAETLLERLLNEEKAGIIETYLDDAEVEIVKRGLNEVEKEIEEWELHTRIGVSLKKIKEIAIFK
jgi:hypothetical protein